MLNALTVRCPGLAGQLFATAEMRYVEAAMAGSVPRPKSMHVGNIYAEGSPHSRIGRMKHTAAEYFGSLSATPKPILALIAAHREARVNNSLLTDTLKNDSKYCLRRFESDAVWWVHMLLLKRLGSNSSNYLSAMEKIAEISTWLSKNPSQPRKHIFTSTELRAAIADILDPVEEPLPIRSLKLFFGIEEDPHIRYTKMFMNSLAPLIRPHIKSLKILNGGIEK